MAELPKSLEQAIAQAVEATQAALAAGYTRLQVELQFPELKPMLVAEQFLPAFESYGSGLKLFFPDAGAAALARRDWGEKPFKIVDIGTGRVPVSQQIQPEDQLLIFLAPTAVEVLQVEKLCEAATDRPVVLLNPSLEDVSIVGIGYAARQLRDRFLSQIESCYHIRPLESAALFRCYPSPWQVWQEVGDDYQLIAEQETKPAGDEIDLILFGGTDQSSDAPAVKSSGFFTSLQRFLRTLSR